MDHGGMKTGAGAGGGMSILIGVGKPKSRHHEDDDDVGADEDAVDLAKTVMAAHKAGDAAKLAQAMAAFHAHCAAKME